MYGVGFDVNIVTATLRAVVCAAVAASRAGGDEQRPFLIESDLADAAPPGLHEAAVAARKTADRAAVQFLDQLGFPLRRE